MPVAPSVPHTLTRHANNDALLFFLAQKVNALPREERFASHSCVLGVARIHAVPSPGTGGLSALRLMAPKAQCVARLLYITSALFFSLLLSDPVQVPQQWPDAQNTHGTQRYTSIGAFMRKFTFEYMHIHYSFRGSLGCVTGTVWQEVKSAVGVLQSAEESMRFEFKAGQFGYTWSTPEGSVDALARTARDVADQY